MRAATGGTFNPLLSVDVDLAFDGDGIEIEEQCLVSEGKGITLTVKLFGLDGIGGVDDDVVGHRVGNNAVDVRETEEVLLVGGVVHTMHRSGGIRQATLEGIVHFVGAAVDGLAGGFAFGIDKTQFFQSGRVGNKTGIEATTPLRLGKKSANYTNITLRKTADPELPFVSDIIRHFGGHIGLVEIGLYIRLQQLAQTVNLGLGAGKEIVEDGF